MDTKIKIESSDTVVNHPNETTVGKSSQMNPNQQQPQDSSNTGNSSYQQNQAPTTTTTTVESDKKRPRSPSKATTPAVSRPTQKKSSPRMKEAKRQIPNNGFLHPWTISQDFP